MKAKHKVRADGGHAFLPDNNGKLLPQREAETEAFGEEFLASALRGESVSEQARDEISDDEEGGPFFVLDDDASMPSVAEGGDIEREGQGAVRQSETMRGALWASRN